MLNIDGLKFDKPRIVMTSRGEREVCGAELVTGTPAAEAFWDAWRARKAELKAAGYSVTKQDGVWKVSLWKETMQAEVRAANLEASRATDAAVNIPRPDGLEYLPFQRAGIAYALAREGTLIGDEMGLGKTIQAIGVANATGAQRILVVAPASVLLNWRNEIKRWQTLNLPVTVVRPGRSTFSADPGWYIINYDIVARYDEELKRGTWDLAVYDEVHRCKTRDALRTVVLFGGRKKRTVDGQQKMVTFEPVPAKRNLALTGTPILNRPAELFSILHRLDPKRFSAWKTFANRYCWSGYDYNGARNLDELNARLRETVMVRRLKKDVLKELPAKRREVVALEVETLEAKAAVDAENEIFDRTNAAVEEAQAEKIRAEAEGNAAAYEAAVAKLRKAQSVAFTEMSRVRHETAVRKIPSVLARLEDVDGKALIFAHHIDVLDALCDGLKDRGVVRIDGSTPNQERQAIVDRFQSDEGIQFFVGGIIPAGVGLTLTAASQVFFAELDWVPGNVTQAEDRAHRIGQQDSVNVYHLVFDGSLDSKMAKMLVEKQRVADAALDNKVEGTEKAAPAVVEAPLAEIKAPVEQPKRLDQPALTPAQTKAVHEALRIVAGYDTDRARDLNGMGFSKFDTEFGCDLAARHSLTPRQALAARKMVSRYKKQYSAELFGAMFGEGGAS